MKAIDWKVVEPQIAEDAGIFWRWLTLNLSLYPLQLPWALLDIFYWGYSLDSQL